MIKFATIFLLLFVTNAYAGIDFTKMREDNAIFNEIPNFVHEYQVEEWAKKNRGNKEKIKAVKDALQVVRKRVIDKTPDELEDEWDLTVVYVIWLHKALSIMEGKGAVVVSGSIPINPQNRGDDE